MAGIKGMIAKKQRENTTRRRIWQSMRIFRRFTLPDLCRTADANSSNTRKFLRRLVVHGYVQPIGGRVRGRAGSYQGWRLVHDIGPNYPMRCDKCGRPLGEACTPPDGGDDQ